MLDFDDTNTGKVCACVRACVCAFDPSQMSVKKQENIKCTMTKVQSSNTLDVLNEVRPLISMSGQVATLEQQIDLLGFWA